MNLPRDFKEFIELAISANLKFLVIGGWAFNRYAEPRMTGAIDFFVGDTPESEQLLKQVLQAFGFGDVLPDGPLFDKTVIMLGRSPYRIDLLCKIDGITFDQAWENRQYEIVNGTKVPFISLPDLIQNKSATGRQKDEADLAVLRRIHGDDT
jgi:hypothetical protein